MTKSDVKILFCGAGFRNKGAEAMLLTAVKEVTKRLSSVHVSAFLRPDEAEESIRCGVEPITDQSRLSLLIRLWKNPSLFWKAAHDKKIIHRCLTINQADVVFDISGYAYGRAKNAKSTERAQQLVEYCSDVHKPYIFLPQAWGPFEEGSYVAAIRSICEKAAKVYARDAVSLASLEKISDSPAIFDAVVPDIAFKFEGKPRSAGLDILRRYGIAYSDEAKLIGVVPNFQVTQRMAFVNGENPYITVLSNAVNYFTQKLDASVVLMPHHIPLKDGKDLWDIQLCEAIKAKAVRQDRCFILKENYSAATIKSIIGCCQLLLASRYHSLIAALSQQVPVVAVGWSHKYKELLRLLDLEEYELDYRNLEVEKIIELVAKAWDKREEIRYQIGTKLPEINCRIDRLFDQVVDQIHPHE